MEDGFGNDYLTIVDEDGNEFELELLDSFEMDDELYMAFVPTDVDEDSEDYGVIMLKAVEEDGEELLVEIEDEDEEESAFEVFLFRNPDESEDFED